MTQSPKWKEDDDEAVEISIEADDGTNWKAVGSHSRRASLSVRSSDISNKSSPPQQQHIQQQDLHISSEKQWGSFGGFQWEGPSIFDEELSSVPNTPLSPNTPDLLYDPTAILSVPMLPGVSLEPSYRPQRSFSFSMGQDLTFFGYDDYARNALAPTMEEEEEHHDQFSSFDDAYLRSRSQSSNAAYGINPSLWASPTTNRNNIRSSNIYNRRSSLGYVPATSFMPTTPMMENGSSNILSQRRMSQPSLITDFSFPDIPNGGPSNSSLLSGTPSLLVQRLENIHINRSTSSSVIKQQPPPETILIASVSTPQQMQHGVSSIGKGLLLQRLPPHIPLFMVEFKSGRTDFYYASDISFKFRIGDLVIVEADRGKDLGKVATAVLTVDQVVLLKQQQHSSKFFLNMIDDSQDDTMSSSESHVKRIFRQANADEINMLLMKHQDEQRALSLCLQKIKNRKLPMEVVDAEFQWDRRKLTFYFIAERRIDFRELVRELFKIYKARIWMCAVNPILSGKSLIS